MHGRTHNAILIGTIVCLVIVVIFVALTLAPATKDTFKVAGPVIAGIVAIPLLIGGALTISEMVRYPRMMKEVKVNDWHQWHPDAGREPTSAELRAWSDGEETAARDAHQLSVDSGTVPDVPRMEIPE